MTPTLRGRIETRLLSLCVVGLAVTAAVTPLLPTDGALSLAGRYRATLVVLVVTVLLGLGWEVVYHAVQQFRWEKDWPTLYGLLTGASEGAVVWLVIHALEIPGADAVGLPAFVVDFVAVWIVVWAFVNGPIRVVFPRWRYRGGRVL